MHNAIKILFEGNSNLIRRGKRLKKYVHSIIVKDIGDADLTIFESQESFEDQG